MSNELVKFDLPDPLELQQEIAQDTRPAFLPRVSLQHGVSAAVADGKASEGDILVGTTNVGKACTIIAVDYRPHAIMFGDDDEIKESFVRNDPLFVEIKAAADRWKPGAYFGPDYLVYVVEAQQFASCHFARMNKDAGGKLGKFLGKPAKLFSQMTQTKKRKVATLDVGPSDLTDLPKILKDDLEWAREKFREPLNEENTDEAPAGPAR